MIIGEGPEKESLFSLAKNFGLKDNIVFRDFLEYRQMIAHMKSSRVFVFPSTREGFGIVVVEAMACGLPVITVKHQMNAACELISDGENGFICRPEENDLTQKTAMILKNESLRCEMSRKAKEFARQYSWDIIAEENEAFYSQILSGN